jgi:predicted NUDIX family phosphoesterase
MGEYDGLKREAERLRLLLEKQARKAYVVEITGTPKAGKSSAIGLVESFFKSCGWRIHVVRERAAECPIPMKGHFFFNTWTTATMLAEVLAVADSRFDLVILDRGFFDALVWLELQRRRQQVTEPEAEAFENFVLLDRWRALVDLTIVMSVSPDQAIARELTDRLIPRRGSLMNERALQAFNRALESARDKHGHNFQLDDIDCETPARKAVAADILKRIMARVDHWVDAPIAVVPKEVVEEVFANAPAVQWPAAGWERLAASVRYEKRSAVEQDDRLVQLVAGGVATRDDGVFVFDRAPDEQRVGEYGRHAIWRGGHLVRGPESVERAARASVIERFRTNLHLGFDFEPQPLGIVWIDDAGHARSRRHLGILYEVRIVDENVAQSLEDKEFKTSGRGHPATSRFARLEELSTIKLESWSEKVVSANWLGTDE